MLVMNSGKQLITDGMELPNQDKIRTLGENKTYKQLGILKMLWNMKVTIVPIVIGAFGTITKGLSKGLKDLEVSGRVETI